MRDKLIDLICSVKYGNESLVGKNFKIEFIEKIADHLIAHGVTIAKDNNVLSKWVPVSERLPDRTTFVLAYITAVGRSYVGVRGYVEEDKNIKVDVGETVIYWMPIPKAPWESKPVTNADRIRAMTNEELAKFLDDNNSQGCVCPARDCRATCIDCIADWLKQPAEEDT